MKVLVLGASGMAGHVIAMYLHDAGHAVTTLTRTPFPYLDNINCDVTDFPKLKSIIEAGDYAAVVNCVGILNQYAEADPAMAILLNAYLPHFLADILKNSNTKLSQMSTDCVFSGKAGSYIESSTPDGEGYYDRTKALGEIDNSKDLTFRESIVGPDMHENGIGLFNWFMRQKSPIGGYTKAIWTGVTTLTLAKAMETAIASDLTGIYHLVNNQIITKYKLLKLFNQYFKNNAVAINENPNFVCNKSLVNTRKDFAFVVPSYEVMVREMRDWVYAHKELYPHYFQ